MGSWWELGQAQAVPPCSVEEAHKDSALTQGSWQSLELRGGERGFVALRSHLLSMLVPNVSPHFLFLELCSPVVLPRDSLVRIQLKSGIK